MKTFKEASERKSSESKKKPAVFYYKLFSSSRAFILTRECHG